MLKTTLQQLGLSEKEISIYLTLLPLGSASASVLSYRSEITRSTTRYVCNQLVKKGLINVSEKGSTFTYTAESPEKILYLLEQDKQELAEKEAQASRIIGELKAMANPAIMLPKVRFYEGVEGIIKVYEDTLVENKDIHAFENVETMIPEVKKYVFEDYIPRRSKNGVFVKVITPNNKDHLQTRKDDKKYMRETKFFPKLIPPIEIEINIYGNKTALFSYKEGELFAVIIESTGIANSMRSIFKFCWMFSK
jgi:sugar-specific transcriptional regulator TrmB